MSFTRTSKLCLIAAAILACGTPALLANCTETGGFAVFQCANLAYFGPPPVPVTFDAIDRPTNISFTFWQVGFGNGNLSTGTGSAGTGNSGATTFNGNDAGFLGVNIRDAASATGQASLPAGATCISTLNWADTGIDGCSDNNRNATLNTSDDSILNGYFDWYYQSQGQSGYYSLNWQQDYPMAVLLKAPATPFTCDTSAFCDLTSLTCVGGPRSGLTCSALRDLDCGFCTGGPNANGRCQADHQCADSSKAQYYAFAVVATLNRGNTGGNGPCSPTGGTNPAPCDVRPGFFDLQDVTNGAPNPLVTGRNNVVTWQPVPLPLSSNNRPDPNNASNTLVDLDWTATSAKIANDASSRPSTNPAMGGGDCTGPACPATLTDPTRASGVGFNDIVTKFGPLVRYNVIAATDANFTTITGQTETTNTTLAGFSVPSSGCYRLQTIFGKKSETATTSTANCRVGKCGDTGYSVQSNVICLGTGCTPTGPEICDNLDNDCDGTVDNFPTTCGVGACASTGTCAAGVDSCTPGAPTTEICNNADDDCDGTVDSFATTCGVGACASTGTCTAGIDSCTPLPAGTEVCNNIDDDCDGTADEGNPGGGLSCQVPGQLGECQLGFSSCESGSIVCNQVTFPASEVCDNLDNDCNGTIDAFATTCGLGICASTGTCTAGVDTCTPGTPTTEVCNGLDDNCNGFVDDAIPGGCGGCTPTGPEVCDGADNDCNGTVDDVTPTPTTCGVGACASTGETTCVAGVPGDTCVPGTPVPETCNSIDDDCDGTVDDVTPTPTTCGVGACASTGTTTCVAGVPGDTCTPGTPTTEVCNNIDDDCDGTVDSFVTSCGVGACAATGTCTAGVNTCTPGTPTAETCNSIDDDCNGVVDDAPGGCQCTPTGPEVCDNIDNDCNGTVDDVTPTPTTCGVGACASTGTTTCVAGVPGDTCTPALPGTETCNGIDDDCNGVVDDVPSTPTTCGVGACASTGTTTCVGGVPGDSCTPGTPTTETCNGIDDDCNGVVDDAAGGCGCIPTGPEVCDGADNDCNGTVDDVTPTPTTCGVGACASTGQTTCVAGVPGDTCVPGTPTAETCNGVDDNCNGTVDDVTPTPTSCGVGACASTGQTTCIGGVPGDSCTPGAPSAETCNGIDDNCNGVVDDVPTTPTTCGVGACASTGQTTCVGGTPGDTCTPGTPTTETCNGIDDDCNGIVDDAAGGCGCTPTGIEVCDGVDNDCNGTVDDVTPTPTTCGVGACASTGMTTCVAGVPGDTCTPGTPTTETCDGVDNDCDGTVDDGNPGGGASCSTGQPGVCSAGTNSCSGGALICVPNTQPSAEVCDGLDNDCNGIVDDVPGGCGVTGLVIVSPTQGQTLDCSADATPPTIQWTTGPWDKFQVFLSWDPNFAPNKRIVTGSTESNSYTVNQALWRKACKYADPFLYIQVQAKDFDVKRKDGDRKGVSPTVQVNTQK